MNRHQLEAICQRLHLGTPVGIARLVAEGHSHQLWCMETTQGFYSVKRLSAQHVTAAALRAAHQRSEQIAAAMAAVGIPAQLALRYRNHPVLTIGRHLVVVSPWVEGQILLLPGSASLEQVQQLGALLGQMHALPLTLADLDLPTWRVWRDDDWVLLARRATAAQVPCAEAVRAMLPDLRWWSRLARDANPRLWQTLVVSHRALTPGKVIWRDAHLPVILDWASAGLINPPLDLVETALIWSSAPGEAPDQTRFTTLIGGYHRAGGRLQESADDAVVGMLGRRLERLEAHLQRTLDSAPDAREAPLVWSEIERRLRALHQLGQRMSQVVAWVERGFAP